MDQERIDYLRRELDEERISMAELAEIAEAFGQLDPATLSDRPENATAEDMLDEIERHVHPLYFDGRKPVMSDWKAEIFRLWHREALDDAKRANAGSCESFWEGYAAAMQDALILLHDFDGTMPLNIRTKEGHA